MSERGAAAYLRWLKSHNLAEDTLLDQHRLHQVGTAETSDKLILTCETCHITLIEMPLSVAISREALLSAGWNQYSVNSLDGPAAYWISLSDPGATLRTYGDNVLEVRFEHDYDTGREFLVLVLYGGNCAPAWSATTLDDLDILRRLFTVTPRNKEASDG